MASWSLQWKSNVNFIRISGGGVVFNAIVVGYRVSIYYLMVLQNPDFSQEVSLKLGPDGELGSFVGPSGNIT